MQITDSTASGRQVIEGYGEGAFRVSRTLHKGSLLVFADRTAPWAVTDMAELTAEALAEVARAEPPIDVLLLGCGAKAAMVPKPLRDALRAEGVVIEAMDTGAACRTFNLLMAEERRAAAALIAVE
ncbi:MAG: Mth938-like domain-containing protein [Kiloniellales bacterium]|nr:Mth938-like domain-containing protein [Kiloniellales bacterium]